MSEDPNALDELFRTHRGWLRRYIGSRVSDRDLADDLTVDVFVRAARSGCDLRRGFGGDRRRVERWLTTIASRLVTDYYRSAHRRLEIPASDLALTLLEEPRDPLAEFERRHDAGLLLRGALAALPADRRRILVDRFVHERTYREVAACTRRPVGVIKSGQSRALDTVRQYLAAQTTAQAAV